VPGGYASNRAGGILGGISTGAPIVARCAVKPTPSIALPQRTVDAEGKPVEMRIGGRHDPCIAPRLVPVAEAMLGLVLADALLVHGAYVAFRER
jgi:chorismate synthase